MALLLAALDRNAAGAAAGDALGLRLRQGHRLVHAAPLERFQARRRHRIGFRHYAANRSCNRPRRDLHPRLVRLQRRHNPCADPCDRRAWRRDLGVDIRGHGGSGTRGDIGYVGQLEDDLADFVAEIRKTAPGAPLTLIGHSAGGGFSLRVAATPIMQDMFVRTVLLAPYLGYDAPTNRPNSGGWANADIPRILGADRAAQDRGSSCCAAAAGAGLRGAGRTSEKNLVSTYTDRLMRNFAVSGDIRLDLRGNDKADDDLLAAPRTR